MFTFEAYAEKICRHAGLPPRAYEAHSLNTVILSLPFGAAHAALDEQPLETLPVLGEDISLAEHMQANFFDVVASPERELWEFTAPVLVKRGMLERLAGCDEWRTLESYLEAFHLQPIFIFKNTYMCNSTLESEYISDLRVLCLHRFSCVRENTIS